MNASRFGTLRAAVATLAPPDAAVERVTASAAEAIDALSPRRRSEIGTFLDLLALPMRAPTASRAAMLRACADSPLEPLRSGFAALKRLTLFLAYAESTPDAPNPTWARLGYPGPRDDAAERDVPLALSLADDGERVVADVVVIGSGAGGGAAADVFARDGRRVVGLEAGPAFDATTFSGREISLAQTYLEGGRCASDDLAVVVLAGATLGGGTTVNWCTSFRLDADVAAEWSEASGIPSLAEELAAAYDALEDGLELAPAPHNRNNRVIVDGARELGWHAAAMPRSAPPDCGDGCGSCGFGCRYAKKRSTPRVFLPEVVARGGAVYADATVERILFDGRRARGVAVTQRDARGVRRFTVEAPLVVVAAGALRTPGVLARSGVAHPLLGRRLFLHPVVALSATFPHAIEAWHGPMQSAYSDHLARLDGIYGVKIEVSPGHPGIAGLATPWRSAAQHAALMSDVGRSASLIAIARDREPGSISLDDEAKIRYRVSPFDGAHLLRGLAGMAEIAFAAGAERVTTLHARPIAVARADWDAAAFARAVRARGIAPNRQPYFSAHQMGTAALGADPRRSVCDPAGRVRGVDGVIVADTSLFPLASGVNPMLTAMALARRIATLNVASGVRAAAR